jgi:hypothetical protein
VPGFEPRFGRPSRSELAVAYLARAHVEPLATLGWMLVATGLRIDYTPPVLEERSAGPAGWGSLFVRLKFRLDAGNVPVLPRRPP